MGMGFNGHRCEKCRIEWNTMWSSVTMQFPKYECPKCGSKDIQTLKHIVPFAIPKPGQGMNEHYCICGNVFEAEGKEITCPSCSRTNKTEGTGIYNVPPSNPNGYKGFGKAITRLTPEDLKDIFG